MVLMDKECFCGDNAQKEYLFCNDNWQATAFMEANSRATRFFGLLQQHGSQVPVVVSEIHRAWVSAAEALLATPWG